MASPTLESDRVETLDAGQEEILPARRRRLRMPGKVAAVGTVLLVVYVLAALASFLPFLPDPNQIATAQQLTGPSPAHWMGTDQFGRDQFVRVLSGARISLEVIVPAALLAGVVGTFLGLVAGYFGTVLDNTIMRVVDIFFAFPPVLLALAIIAALGGGIYQLVAATAIVYTPMFVRTVRGPVLSLRERDYVQAGLAMGAGSSRILGRHILPLCTSVIVVQLTLTLSWALLTETALSFLGVGLQPPTPDLGTMLSDGSQFTTLDPWLAVFPGFAIVVAVLGFNLVGDALRDALDPKTRRLQEAGVR
jgi:peptide/nickel transport system permease protein